MSPLLDPTLAGAALAEALERARPEHALLVASVPAPCGGAGQLRAVVEGDHMVSWAPGDQSGASGPVVVGLGAAHIVQASGPERFALAQVALRDGFARIGFADEETRALPLRFYGGAAFVPGRDGSGCWQSFGDATFVLPRWLYVDDGASARLAVVYDRTQDDVADIARRAAELLAAAAAGDVTPSSLPQASAEGLTAELECQESTSESEWRNLIDSIRRGIRSGTYAKVVAARRSTLRLSPAPEPALVLGRLDELAPRCTRFGLRIGTRTFLGATPERLVRRSGSRVLTEAIAGSIPATVAGGAEQLLSSHKDLAEHRYVVDAIVAVLRPLASHIEVAERPEVRQLRHILHLRTPVTAELSGDVHVLELTSRLHPTPAVGGVPTERALDWIVSSEPATRGWYASPFGWVDASGDGEMVVALRSALINGDRVHLYAGAGIVDESDAAAEYEETEVKLAGMRAALGLGAEHAPPRAERDGAQSPA